MLILYELLHSLAVFLEYNLLWIKTSNIFRLQILIISDEYVII